VVPLDGTWRFKLEQAPAPPRFLGVSERPIPIDYPATPEPFYRTDYREDTNWHELSVPGNWEIAGFSPATYNQPDNASGLYRLRFEVPVRWKGRLVRINFDGVQNGCELWCNGQPVPVDECSWGRTNYHESGWTAWQADLTPAIKFGQRNLLALRVTKNTKSIDCDTGDFFLLGGVYRPVTLFSVPSSHIRDLTIRTTLRPDDQAELCVLVQLSQAISGAKVTMRLEGQAPVEGEPDANGLVKLTQVVAQPKLWSAEFPNLYALAIELKTPEGRVTERLARRVGIREVSIQNGILLVNHVPVKLAGICRHEIYPPLGNALNADVWRKDLELMKAANFNAVRTSHYPYGSGFYDLCDEMGFYVLDEEPFCWVNCDDPALTPAFEQRARETVRRDKNHPCVVIWGIGNENSPGRNNTLAAHITGETDPTRPRLVSCQRAQDGGADVEFDDAHYVTPHQIHQAEHDRRRAQWPMIYTENPNVWDVRNGPDYGSLDLWAPVIVRTWEELWQDDHVSGTFLWEWQDRAVADRCPTKYYYFDPTTGIELVKVKGVVDGFRNPRPEYYHIKMAQCPIVLGGKPEIEPDGVVVQLTNRYSFTDLLALRVKWQLRKGFRTVARGPADLKMQPRSHGPIRLGLPAKALDEADALKLEFDHPGGWNVLTCELVLKPIDNPVPRVKITQALPFPRFNLVTGKIVPDNKGWRRLERVTGQLTNVIVQRKGGTAGPIEPAALAALTLAEVETLEAEVLLQPSEPPAGRLRAQLSNGELSYSLSWTAPKTDVYELGWIFAAPEGARRFSWDRQPLWSYYPPKHIGRATGMATPESAHVALTKVDRADAFDFDSTKFNCNWATLTDAGGRGLCVVFPSDQREHVRGGLEPNGNCSLVVNRCYSPPRDISSAIVPDLYSVLKSGDQISARFSIDGKPTR